MTISSRNPDEYVRRAVNIMASALGPVVADVLHEPDTSALATDKDPSNLLGVMIRFWHQDFEPLFGRPHNRTVHGMLHNVRRIRNYYVGDHRDNPCDFDQIDAVGEIRRLVSAFSKIDRAEQSVADAAGEIENLKKSSASCFLAITFVIALGR